MLEAGPVSPKRGDLVGAYWLAAIKTPRSCAYHPAAQTKPAQ